MPGTRGDGGGQCFLGTEFQFRKISEKVLEMAGGDGYKTK